MRKLSSLLLTLIFCLSLAACSSGNTDESSPSIGSDVLSPASSEVESDTQEVESTQPEDEITFDEVTAVDNDECSIVITGIDPDNFWGYTLSVNLENKSSEKTYMFSVSSAAVDGVQCDPFFASEVAAGKKSVDSISFMDSSLEENGVNFTDIELTFRVYDSNDWTADEAAVETVHVYPYGEDKAEVFERVSQSSDNVIIDNEYVTVTVIGYEEDSLAGYAVNLFLQNKTDTEVMFSVDEASVNGYMADPFWATSVMPGKCAFSSMSWFNTTLEESGITGAIEEIEFVFRAHNYGDWLADDFANETITLNP